MTLNIFNVFNTFSIFKKKKTKRKFPFNDDPNSFAFTCVHVINKERPILKVVHELGGDWQFLCGELQTVKDAKVVTLKEIYKIDPTLAEISQIKKGSIATRDSKTGKWTIKSKYSRRYYE